MDDEPDELTVDLHVEGDAAIIAITGEIDIATRDAITDAARAALDGGAARLVLDMSGVTFMDSSGIAALIETCAHGAVTLRAPSQVVVRLIATIGMTDSFVIEPASRP